MKGLQHSRLRPGGALVRTVSLAVSSIMILASLGVALFSDQEVPTALASGGSSPQVECEGYDYYLKFENWDGGSPSVSDTNGSANVLVNVTETKEGSESLAFDWSSDTPMDKMIVKAGNKSNNNVYDLGGAQSGSGSSLDNKGISHVTFCWNGNDAPPTETEPPSTTKITVKKEVVNAPQGDATWFEFDSSFGPFSLPAGGWVDSGDIGPGSYSVSEINIPINWELTSATCDDGSPVNAIELSQNEQVTCIFTNTYKEPAPEPGKIIVKKVTNPAGDTTQFEFDSSWGDNFTLSDGQTNDSGDLDAGTYSVTEVNIPANWSQTSATCDDGSDPGNIALAEGETVTCTFTNTYSEPQPETGTIIVKKTVKDAPEGDASQFEFDPSWAENFMLGDGDSKTFDSLTPSNGYAVSEVNLSDDWAMTVSCTSSEGGTEDPNNIDLSANEVVTCEFVNTYCDKTPGSITVVKQTVPDGSDETFNFDLQGLSDGSFHVDIDGLADGGSHTVSDLPSSSWYSLTEVVPDGWDLTDVTCVSKEMSGLNKITNGYSMNVAPGEHWTCTFTNTQEKPEFDPLTVSKTVDATGTLEYGWTIEKTADPTSLTLEEGDSSGVLYTLDVTRELVSESYSATGMITIKNDNQDAVTITAINDVITQGETETTAALTDCVTPFSLDAGQEVTCHYEATLPNGTAGSNSVSVITEGDAANGSATESFEVEVTTVNETAQVTDTNAAFEGPKTVFDTDQLTYTVPFDCSMIAGDYDENGSKTGSFDNTAQVGDGTTVFDEDTATVDLTCSNPPPGIQIVKTADPLQVTAPGGDVIFSFEIANTATDEAVTITSLMDDVFGDLTQRGDCQLVGTTIEVGGSVSCSFTEAVNGEAGDVHHNTVTVEGVDDDNTKVSDDDDATVNIVAPEETPAIQIIKSAEPTTVVEPGEDVTFTFTITNTSATLPVTITSLSDDVFGDLTQLGNCQLVGETLAAGQSAFCSFVAPVNGSAGETHHNTVTVTGEDPNGTKVSDQDDATVEIIAASEAPAIRVVKSADPTQISSVGENVTYTFTVTNPTADRTIVVDQLDDSLYGQLGENPDGLLSNDCALPQTLGPGADYTCQITVFIDGEVGDQIVNVVTVRGHDEETNEPVSDDDDATVTVVAEPPVVIPEAPMAVLFPLAGLLMAAGAWFVWRRRRMHEAG